MSEKITLNGEPLERFFERQKSKEIASVVKEESIKYWKSKSRYRYACTLPPSSKGRVLEDWEVFVYSLDKIGVDIADLDIDQLHAKWKIWKKYRIVQKGE